MNKTLRNLLIGLGAIVLAAVVFGAGQVFARMANPSAYQPGVMMRGWNDDRGHDNQPGRGNNYGPGGMMGNRGNGYEGDQRGSGPGGMMGNRGNGYGDNQSGGGSGGMMNGSGMGPGMMGNGNSGLFASDPLSTADAYAIASQYLADLKNDDLKIKEIMIFDNQAYVRVIELSTGKGAFELLVDNGTDYAYPELGPNMMWNLKYGGQYHAGMMGWNNTIPDATAEMTVSPEQALTGAQAYLDKVLPGTKTAADADAFYGYYTLDVERDGRTIGMLSVNGFTGDVFLHTWHGNFIEEKEYQ